MWLVTSFDERQFLWQPVLVPNIIAELLSSYNRPSDILDITPFTATGVRMQYFTIKPSVNEDLIHFPSGT